MNKHPGGDGDKGLPIAISLLVIGLLVAGAAPALAAKPDKPAATYLVAMDLVPGRNGLATTCPASLQLALTGTKPIQLSGRGDVFTRVELAGPEQVWNRTRPLFVEGSALIGCQENRMGSSVDGLEDGGLLRLFLYPEGRLDVAWQFDRYTWTGAGSPKLRQEFVYLASDSAYWIDTADPDSAPDTVRGWFAFTRYTAGEWVVFPVGSPEPVWLEFGMTITPPPPA